jgi:hypothetical protein
MYIIRSHALHHITCTLTVSLIRQNISMLVQSKSPAFQRPSVFLSSQFFKDGRQISETLDICSEFMLMFSCEDVLRLYRIVICSLCHIATGYCSEYKAE